MQKAGGNLRPFSLTFFYSVVLVYMSWMDAEMPSIFECDMVKARKEHRCCECSGLIQKSEKYEYVRGLWDGSWDRFKTCVDCADLRNQISRIWKEDYTLGIYDCPVPPFQQLSEHVFEMGGERHREYLIFRWQTNRRKRQSPPSRRNWMTERENQAWLQVALGPEKRIWW